MVTSSVPAAPTIQIPPAPPGSSPAAGDARPWRVAVEKVGGEDAALLTHGVADGDAQPRLLKVTVRKIVEETLEAESGRRGPG